MRLTRVAIENFRLLEKVEVGFDDVATLIVGRNNSGKTSLVNVFEKFFGHGRCPFVFEDLSANRIADIKRALDWYEKSLQEGAETDGSADDPYQQALALIPEIRLRLTIRYQQDDDLAPLSVAILDLDENCFDVTIEAVLRVTDKEGFLKEAHAAGRRTTSPNDDRYLRRQFSRYFKTAYFAVSSVGQDPVTKELNKTTAQEIISVDFVYAQNKLDDSGMDRTKNLSKTFEAYYHANNAEEARNADIDELDDVLAEASQMMDNSLRNLFASFLVDAAEFGIRTSLEVPQIVAQLEASTVLQGSTRVEYPSKVGNTAFPEGHNGLGFSKLIFTILQIISFHEVFRRATPRPAVRLLFIEEPEAHLHPQMQEVFIGNIRRFLEKKADWNVQVAITTHSSHIVARSGFECVRYFYRSDECRADVRDLMDFQDDQGKKKGGGRKLEFLRQYMELRQCDMFFADAIILIEGTVERLLLPKMIRMRKDELERVYVSVVEVGGANALNFKEIIDFLKVPTLVITDIDSVEATRSHPTCRPLAAGAITSNPVLKMWLPKQKLITDLLAMPDDRKIYGRVRVAYQVPEAGELRPGRSFEEAFVLANAHVLADRSRDLLRTQSAFRTRSHRYLTAQQIGDQAFEVAARLKDKKTDFAFDLIALDGWSVPRYIEEGLTWLLSQTQSPS